jgi:hypothetical protein
MNSEIKKLVGERKLQPFTFMWVKISKKRPFFPSVTIGTTKITKILEKLELDEMSLPSESLVQLNEKKCEKYLVFVIGVKDHW